MAIKQLISQKHHAQLETQLNEERRLVSFDSYDLSVRQLLDMFETDAIIIPPDYQRQFIWNEARQSSLIESAFLGIPIPSLFMATNPDSTWEVVDGVQRMGTLAHFVGAADLLKRIKKPEALAIAELEKLRAMNGLRFIDLPQSIQLKFLTRPVRVTVLNDKSDLSVRFDLFERLNTGGVTLTDQEIRNCVFRGPFNDSIKQLSEDENFRAVIHLKPADQGNGTREELALRFFAFLDCYEAFDHSVKGFLNDYMRDRAKKEITKQQTAIFVDTFAILRQVLPRGIVRGERAITPVNLFEAIAVGTAIARKANQQTDGVLLAELLSDPDLRKLTTGATNSRKMVTGRINFVRDRLV